MADSRRTAEPGNAVLLQPGGDVEVGGTQVAIWWSDRPGVVRVKDSEGAWRAVDLGQSPDAHKSVTEWARIPGTGLEIREAAGPPQMWWGMRPIGVDPI